MSKLTYNHISNSVVKVTFDTIELGSLSRLEDNFYYWFPPDFNGGCTSEWVLRDIANKLNALNKDYNDFLDKNMNL